MAILGLLAGLVLLVGGAELLVRGASKLAVAAGISPLVIGLTVVAYGTSAPELAVSLNATLHGQADVAVGNVVGSNIFNVLFILGISAVVSPLVVSAQLVRLDVPVMIAASFALLGIGLDGRIGRIEGAALALAITVYTVHLIRAGQKETRDARVLAGGPASPRPAPLTLLANLALALAGLALLVAGSRLLVNGAITIATRIGVSELVIGLTVVAAGTSLPELATSVLATVRGERDIAVGNIVGSNVFNILAILGVCGLVGEGGVAVPAAAMRFDIPVMVGVAVLCLPILFTDHRISRREGLLLIGYYIAYVTYLILAAARHDALPVFSDIMLLFVLPVTIAGVLVSFVLRRRA
jgi:cation:H+ antiporter